MSEILNQDGQAFAAPEVPAEAEAPIPFNFSLQADASGITELRFVKQIEPLFGTILTMADYINSTFDQPFPTLGAFLRSLADTADQIESVHAANQQEAVDEGQQPAPGAEEVSAN